MSVGSSFCPPAAGLREVEGMTGENERGAQWRWGRSCDGERSDGKEGKKESGLRRLDAHFQSAQSTRTGRDTGAMSFAQCEGFRCQHSGQATSPQSIPRSTRSVKVSGFRLGRTRLGTKTRTIKLRDEEANNGKLG